MSNSDLDVLMGVGTGSASSSSGGTSDKDRFFSTEAATVIDEYNDANKFFELYNLVREHPDKDLTADHATLAAALLVEADRKTIWRDVNFMTYGWLHEDIRTAFLVTYDPGQFRSFGDVYRNDGGGSPYGPYMWTDDGLKFYRRDTNWDRRYHNVIDVSTPYDLRTKTGDSYDYTHSLYANESSTYPWHRYADGGNFWHQPHSEGIRQGAMSTPYVRSPATTTDWDMSIELGANNHECDWLGFNGDGTKIYFYERRTDAFYWASLATPYDISTRTFSDTTAYLEDVTTSGTQGRHGWSRDGTYFRVGDASSGGIHLFKPSSGTPYDMTTLVKLSGTELLNLNADTVFYARSGDVQITRAYINMIENTNRFITSNNRDTSIYFHMTDDFTEAEFEEMVEAKFQGAYGLWPTRFDKGVTDYAPFQREDFSNGVTTDSMINGNVSWSLDGLSVGISARNSNRDDLIFKLIKVKIPFTLRSQDDIVAEYSRIFETDYNGGRLHPDGKGFNIFSDNHVYNFRESPLYTLEEAGLDGFISKNYHAGTLYSTNRSVWTDDGRYMFYCFQLSGVLRVAVFDTQDLTENPENTPFYWNGQPTDNVDLKALLNTATNSNEELHPDSGFPAYMEISRDGTKLTLGMSGENGRLMELEMTTPYDISTLTIPQGTLANDGQICRSGFNVDRYREDACRTPHGRFSFWLDIDSDDDVLRIHRHDCPSENL